MKALLLVATALITASGCGDNVREDAHSPDGNEPIDGGTIGDGGNTSPTDSGVGIGGNGDASNNTPPPDLAALCGSVPKTLDDWETCYLNRWCAVQTTCTIPAPYLDVNECINRSADFYGGSLSEERRARKRAVEEGRASLNAPAFTKCLADLSIDRCDTAPTANASPDCSNRFTGTILDGGTCYADVECVSPGATCDTQCTDSSCCIGTCHPKLKQGEVCQDTTACEPGLRCHRVCLSGDIGSSCSSVLDCDQGAWCKSGQCVPTLPGGSECSDNSQCGGQTICVGATLLGAPGHCTNVAIAGNPCDSFCLGGLYCSTSGTCQQRPVVGESCSTFVNCLGVDAFCSNDTCVQAGSEGDPCGGSQPCQAGLFCTSELGALNPTCAAPGATGQECAAPSHCESYQCSGNSTMNGVCLAWSDMCPVAN